MNRPELMLVLCTVVWGGTFLAVKFALQTSTPWVIVAIRFTDAAVLFAFLHFSSLRRMNRQMLWRGIVLGFIFFISFGLQTLGLQYTTASRSAFLTETLVLFTPLLSFLLLRKIPTWATLTGAGAVTFGLYLLTSPAGLLDWNRGDWLTLGCALAFSIYILAVDRWSSPETRGSLSVVQSLTVALIAVPFALTEGPRLAVDPTWLWSMLYLIVPGTVLVVMLQMRYQPESTPARAGVIFALEPVFAMLYAVSWGLEPLSSRAVIGAAVVTAGVVWSEIGSRR